MNSKDIFLLIWSIGSGYGMVYAIISWLMELLEVKYFIHKGIISVIIGFAIGGIHFYITVVQQYYAGKDSSSDSEDSHTKESMGEENVVLSDQHSRTNFIREI